MRRSDREATNRSATSAAKRALRPALLLFALAAGTLLTDPGADVARAEPRGDAGGDGTLVYERPAPGPRRGLLSAPAPLVYGTAALAFFGGGAYLVARSLTKP